MNLEYTDPRLTWAGYENTTDTFEIALTSGHADRVALEALYDEVIDSASAFFYRISESDKFPYLYDVVNLNATSSLLTITVEGIVGKVHRDPAPFGEDDYWSVFFGEGHCAPMSGETDNASDRLNSALNDYFTPYQCIFWTETHNVPTADLEDFGWGQLNGADPNPGDFIVDYRTFYSICEHGSDDCEEFVENGVYCLNPDEMNYYFQSIIDIYNDYIDDSGTQLRMSLFGLTMLTGSDDVNYWAGINKFGTRYDCIEGNDFPYALPFCC